MRKQNDEKALMWDNWMYDGKKKKNLQGGWRGALDGKAVWRGLRDTGQGKTLKLPEFKIQMYLVALRSFSYMQKIPVNSLFTFILLHVLSNSLCYGFVDTPII